MALCALVGWTFGCQAPSSRFDGSTPGEISEAGSSKGRVFKTVTDDGTEEVVVEPSDGKDAPSSRRQSRRATRSSPAEATPDKTSDTPNLPSVRAATGPSARVQQVNERLQFSVLDFGVDNIPGATNHMGVYREGKQIGIVRLGSIVRGSTVVADIVSGEIKPGDIVRGIISPEDLPTVE